MGMHAQRPTVPIFRWNPCVPRGRTCMALSQELPRATREYGEIWVNPNIEAHDEFYQPSQDFIADMKVILTSIWGV